MLAHLGYFIFFCIVIGTGVAASFAAFCFHRYEEKTKSVDSWHGRL